MLAYRTPREMLRGIADSGGVVWGVVFQFPFYAGLMGLIKGTGLGLAIANFFVHVSTPETWPLIGFLSQAVINVFIPSGGTQWVVTGEILAKTSQQLGLSPAFAILIEVMGDQVSNMITPLWALPALALSGLRARDILGYTAMVMILGFTIMAVGLTVFRF
jgi:short-chain fatty acids transporter